MSDSTSSPFLRPLLRLALAAFAFGLAVYIGTRDEAAPADTAADVVLEDATPAISASATATTPSFAQGGAGWSAVVLGPARGHLEPCGCSGGQLGGVDRLASVLAATARTASGMAPRIAAGGVVGPEAAPYDGWARAQLESIWEAYTMLGIEAIGLAETDLALGTGVFDLAGMLLPSTTLIASNLNWTAAEGKATPTFATRWQHPAGVGVLSFLPGGLSGESELGSWTTSAPTAALGAMITAGEVDASRPHLVFVESDRAGAEPLARLLGPDSMVFLVTDDYEATKPSDLAGPEGAARIANLGSRLRQVTRIDGTAPGAALGYDVRLVTEDVPGDPNLDSYRGLYRLLLQAYDARSQVSDTRGEPRWGGYTGSESCAECHQEAYDIWAESLHHQGMETLGGDLRGGVGADQDPRCIQCHSVGFGEVGGYGSKELTPEQRWSEFDHLAGIGCESCHGPGVEHSRTESKADIELGGEYTCFVCHDSENDPHFRFDEYWPLIEHGELGEPVVPAEGQ